MHCLVRLYCHMTTDLFVSQASFEPRTCFSNLDSYFMGGSFSESRYWWLYFNKQTDRSHEIILKGTANRSWSFHKKRDKDIEAVPLFSLHRSLPFGLRQVEAATSTPYPTAGKWVTSCDSWHSWVYLKTTAEELAWDFWAQLEVVADHRFTEMNYFQHGTYLVSGCGLPFSQCQGMGPTQKGNLFQLLRSIQPSVEEGGRGRGYPT